MTVCVVYFTLSAERGPASEGQKTARKTSLGSGARGDLEKAAQQQQIKFQEQMESIVTSVKATHEEGHTRESKRAATSERNHDMNTTSATDPEHQGHVRSAQTEMNKAAGKVHPCQRVQLKEKQNSSKGLLL